VSPIRLTLQEIVRQLGGEVAGDATVAGTFSVNSGGTYTPAPAQVIGASTQGLPPMTRMRP